MTTFDFSGYVCCPRGWRILRADSELWLDHIASDRVYMVTAPHRGAFELFYTNIANKEPCFIARSDSMYDILRKAGLLMPQPTMHKVTQNSLSKFGRCR
jgi:hypothetical protein